MRFVLVRRDGLDPIYSLPHRPKRYILGGSRSYVALSADPDRSKTGLSANPAFNKNPAEAGLVATDEG